MIREALAGLARNESVGNVLVRTPVARDAVARLVAGEQVSDAVATAARLADDGYWTALERTTAPEPTPAEAEQSAEAYDELVDAIGTADLAASCEVAVLPEAVGALHDPTGTRDRIAALAERGRDRGVEVRLGFGPTTDIDATLDLARSLWSDGLDVGVTLPAAWRRTETECDRLGDRRIRLVKGTGRTSSPAVHHQPIEIDKAFVRCARRLLRGSGTPSFATHDPRLVDIVEELVARSGRPRSTYEFTFFMGRQEGTQRRLAETGEQVRIYVPYGPQWFERLVAGLAEQPSSLASAVRSLLPGSS